jgi:hypothetical protein
MLGKTSYPVIEEKDMPRCVCGALAHPGVVWITENPLLRRGQEIK